MNRLGPYEVDTIIVGDCLDILRQIPDKCIDLIVTDPPFGTGAPRQDKDQKMPAYDDSQNMDWLLGRLVECVRVLRPKRSMYVWLDHRRVHDVAVLLRPHIPLVNEIIWRVGWVSGYKAKTRKKWVVNHNTILQFGQYEHFETPHRRPKTLKRSHNRFCKSVPFDTVWTDCPSPLHMSFVSGTGHPDEKPLKAVKRLVLATSKPGDLVFDPFIGSGTTALAALALARHYIGCDTNEEFVHMANTRLAKITGVQLPLLEKGGGENSAR